MFKWKIKNLHHWHHEKGQVWETSIFDSDNNILAFQEFSKEDAYERKGRYLNIIIHENLDEELLEVLENA